MSGRLVKSRQFALNLILSVVILLSACAYSLSSSPTTVQPAPTQAAQPTVTSAKTLTTRILEGKVVGVADGDTITVLSAGSRQTRARLQGIDAPESQQAFGQVSKRNLTTSSSTSKSLSSTRRQTGRPHSRQGARRRA